MSKDDVISMEVDKENTDFNSGAAPFNREHEDGDVGEIQTLSRFLEEFVINEHLGRGSFGDVYKVKDKFLKKFFAVKIVRYQRNSLREVTVLSELLHDNIIRYYSCWEEESGYQGNDSSADSSDSSSMQIASPQLGSFPLQDQSNIHRSTGSSASCFLYIQMELCDNKTLTKWIEDQNLNPPNDSERRLESLEIALQITKGVRYIHFKGFIHRDLKPDNILFGLDGAVKIGDFGLVTRDGIQENRSADIGTRSYMAPEQRMNKYDRKVDIFPMGLIFLELWWRVSTGSERAEVFENARCQRLPQHFGRAFFEEMHLIKPTLSRKPGDRPEASALYRSLKKIKRLIREQKKTRSQPQSQSQ